MKKRIALILMVIFCLALTACTNKNNEAPKEPAAAETEKAADVAVTESAEKEQQEAVPSENAEEEVKTNPEETKAENPAPTEKKDEGNSGGEKTPSNVTPPPTVANDGGTIQADAQFGSPGIDD